MIDIRRPDDNELCGRIRRDSQCDDEHDCDGQDWIALTVFGGHLGAHAARHDAEQQVLAEGLASLADRWTLVDSETGNEETVLIQEANATQVVLAIGYYSLPGVPTMTITAEHLGSGRWTLRR